jgi:DNA-binding MarR family transcriptional regulator
LDDGEIEHLLGGRPRSTPADIVGHPRLPEARKLYCDRFLEVYSGDPFLVRLLIEAGRFIVYIWVTVLDAAHDPANRETWPTVGLLKAKMATLGLASGRQIDDIIARLCTVGFLELQPSELDRRVRLLKPTEKLHAHDRDWLVAHYSPHTILFPQYDYGLVMHRDRRFQAVHRRTCVAFAPLGAKMLFAAPDMMLFFNRAAGFMVIAALMQAAMAKGDDDPHATVPYADIGDRFGVSRTHVRKLLKSAEEIGLVKLHARSGHRVEILPKLWSSHDAGMAGGMYFHDVVYMAAEKAFNRADDQRTRAMSA